MNWEPWTSDRTAQLRKLWPDNSATEIAAIIFTPNERRRFVDGGRNAIIGKANRLGLKKRGNPWRPSHSAGHQRGAR